MLDRSRLAARLIYPPLFLVIAASVFMLVAGCSDETPSLTPSSESRTLAPFPDGGWALTEDGLMASDAAGEWADVTPDQFRADGNLFQAEAFFLSAKEAWIGKVAPGSPELAPVVRLSHTADAGQTWQAVNIEVPPDQPVGGSFDVFFLDDSQSGWLLVHLGTGSSFSRGLLYGTSDGGRTWRSLDAPAYGSLVFTGALKGWLAGGPTGSDLYATDDGGMTWERLDMPGTTSITPRWRISFAVPHFFNPLEGVVPVQVRSETADSSELTFYQTTDGGESWRPIGRPLVVQRTDALLVRDAHRLALVDRETWFLAAEDLYATRDGGLTWSPVETSQDVRALGGIDFVSADIGWAYGKETNCVEKGNCVIEAFLIQSTDGGRSWSQVSLPVRGP